MNFIERWLGFAPDAGNGGVELAIVMAVACGALALALWRRRVFRSLRFVRVSVRS